MTEKNRNAIGRLLRGATLTFLYKEHRCVIGHFGKNPIDADIELSKYLVNERFVDLDSGNEHYQEENYVASDKLKEVIWEMSFSLGDTVNYEQAFAGTRKGIITEECDPLGLRVRIGGVKYYTRTSLRGTTRMVLTEKIFATLVDVN